MDQKILLIATTNPGKIREIQSLLSHLPIQLLTLIDLEKQINIFEDGNSYLENALKKGQAYSALSGYITLADDSGLEVDLLNGKPGIHSARFSPKPYATDADRRAYLLHLLFNFPRPWYARFVCNVVICFPNGEYRSFEGVCNGEIIPEERGKNGFGYDPIFLIPEINLTMAELSMEQKNRLSHRARAIQAALPFLSTLLGTNKAQCD
ncbi:MAG: RdgB/HAM1 family non-canonical purine NTP pyrophosphatase [Anaerolineales bacterium]